MKLSSQHCQKLGLVGDAEVQVLLDILRTQIGITSRFGGDELVAFGDSGLDAEDLVLAHFCLSEVRCDGSIMTHPKFLSRTFLATTVQECNDQQAGNPQHHFE